MRCAGDTHIEHKVLIIGASSFLGRKLVAYFSQEFTVIGTHHTKPVAGTVPLDITDRHAVRALIAQQDPAIVILAAAQTNVDTCELDPAVAEAVNIRGTENVAACCANRKLVYYSTDAVFDGVRGNYTEMDQPNPIHQYGKTKLAGERIAETVPDYLIIRTCMLYSDQADNPKFINLLIRNLASAKPVRVITDRYATPTLIDDLAVATLTLVKRNRIGTYHVVGASAHSCYEIAKIVSATFGFPQSLLVPITDADLALPAKRPKYATLSIAKLKAEGIQMSALPEGITRVCDALRQAQALP